MVVEKVKLGILACIFENIYLIGWGGVIQVWGNLGHFQFQLISLKQNGLTAGDASMDFISPLPSEISSAVPSAFWSYRCERGKRGISTGDFF